MTVDELLPDDPAFIVHKRILRGVTLRRGAGALVAECENTTQGRYVELVASRLLLAAARQRFRDDSLSACNVEVASTGTRRALPLLQDGRNVRRVPHPEHSFAIYAPGERNGEAVASIIRFAESSGSDRAGGRLLYVYGPKGSGKTHLLDAVVNEWVSDGLQTQAYRGAELLDVLSSTRAHGSQTLEAYWDRQLNQAPYLAVDDVDVLAGAGMDWAQRGLRGILEAVKRTSAQAIVSGTRVPHFGDNRADPALAAILDKAEVVALKAADLAVRRTIAWNCFQYGHVAVGGDVLDFIARSVVDVGRMLQVCHAVSALTASNASVGIKAVQSILHKQGVPKRGEDDRAVARKTVAVAIEAMGERVPLEMIAGQRIGQEMTGLRNRIVVRLVNNKQLKQKMVAEALGISTQMISLIVKEAKEGV